jgi:hypothetical protein
VVSGATATFGRTGRELAPPVKVRAKLVKTEAQALKQALFPYPEAS